MLLKCCTPTTVQVLGRVKRPCQWCAMPQGWSSMQHILYAHMLCSVFPKWPQQHAHLESLVAARVACAYAVTGDGDIQQVHIGAANKCRGTHSMQTPQWVS
jgi:hypothetical protein